MKKSMMVLAVMGMFLACAQAVFAASQTRVFQVFDGCTIDDGCNPAVPGTDLSVEEGGIHANGWGYATFKTTTKGGGVDVTVQLWGAAKLYTYSVQYGPGQPRYVFTTNNKGNGAVQFHLTNTSAMGPWINIYSAKTAVHLWCAQNPLYAGN